MKEILALFIAGFYCFAQPQDIKDINGDYEPYYYFYNIKDTTTITLWVENKEFHRFMETYKEFDYGGYGTWGYVLSDEAIQILYEYNDRIYKESK